MQQTTWKQSLQANPMAIEAIYNEQSQHYYDYGYRATNPKKEMKKESNEIKGEDAFTFFEAAKWDLKLRRNLPPPKAAFYTSD